MLFHQQLMNVVEMISLRLGEGKYLDKHVVWGRFVHQFFQLCNVGKRAVESLGQFLK